MIKLTNRQKEDRQDELCKHPDESYSREIGQLISQTLKKGNKVFCATDWHLWQKDKEHPTVCHKRRNFDEIIKNITSTIGKDDTLIFLGDLVDGEFRDKDSLKNVLLALPGQKVLVRGNNDLFEYSYYRSCGFRNVTRAFVWSNILFSHFPTKNDNDVNVHGHIHNYKSYYIPYTNQIDVAYLDGRTKPVELMKVIKTQPAYSKLIKECPEHFNEYTSLFDEVMLSNPDCFIPNPYES